MEAYQLAEREPWDLVPRKNYGFSVGYYPGDQAARTVVAEKTAQTVVRRVIAHEVIQVHMDIRRNIEKYWVRTMQLYSFKFLSYMYCTHTSNVCRIVDPRSKA